MSSKNHAGSVFAATVILALHGRLIGIGSLPRLTIGVLAAVAVVDAVTVALHFAGEERNGIFFAFQLVLAAVMFLVPFLDPGAIAGALDRDEAFTGRTDLWAIAFDIHQWDPAIEDNRFGCFRL